MTEQEAKALAARLTRIWLLDKQVSTSATWKVSGITTYFSLEVSSEINLSCRTRYSDMGKVRLLSVVLGGTLNGERTGVLVCGSASRTPRIDRTQVWFKSPVYWEHFAQEWFPFFRRGCWLSGCDIEASAHEKIEWMQGFTREEIKSWKLNL